MRTSPAQRRISTPSNNRRYITCRDGGVRMMRERVASKSTVFSGGCTICADTILTISIARRVKVKFPTIHAVNVRPNGSEQGAGGYSEWRRRDFDRHNFLCSAPRPSESLLGEGNVRQPLHCDTVLAARKFTSRPAIRLLTLQGRRLIKHIEASSGE